MVNKDCKQLLAEANAVIETVSVADAMQQMGKPEVIFVDIRDHPELEREGKIPEAIHVSRGMLEFIVDPTSALHQPIFACERRFLLYCAGGLRSALAAQRLQEMGLTQVAHISGGIKAWKQAGGPVETVKPRKWLGWLRR